MIKTEKNERKIKRKKKGVEEREDGKLSFQAVRFFMSARWQSVKETLHCHRAQSH